MSATVTWASSGLGAKTGTTNQTCLDDLVTLVNSKSADATFKWEVAGSATGATPRYVNLRRKNASPGRIAVIIWDSGPAGNNAAILDGVPLANGLQVAYFPAGTANTLSNLAAASGTVCGDDTGAVKCSSPGTIASVYTTSFQWFYFDHEEGMVFCLQNPAAANIYAMGAGAHLVDNADVAYDCTFGSSGSQRWDNFSAQTQSPFIYTSTAIAAGTGPTQGNIRTNYAVANRNFFHAWVASGNWMGVAQSATDIMSDSANDDYWFIPPQLISPGVKGEGPVLKWRQIGHGPASTSALKAYAISGPIVKARHCLLYTSDAADD